ncbi:NAD(P)-binding protein [Agromyces laixinhei]|uniref:NAD(P)-binding protein n=1 Tax=Agromyces laixinhei TaxID=2585717 RepID=UPI0018DC9317|nr:NAD(P)-binding protein [Agromyces laixinhei]
MAGAAMVTHHLETDYLVIGAGAAGMAFTDALIADADADVVVVDRRHAPGGHWNDAYPFVRLHQPAAYYGVNSLALGDDAIDADGLNAGMYEQAGAAEICGYYDRVMRRNLVPSGSVRYHPMCEAAGDARFVSLVSGDEFEVDVRTAVVDARYLEPSIPATSAPPFDVASEVRCIPVGALTRVAEPPEGRFVVIGAGKTAIDACLWLLASGASPDAIRWIKPREPWLRNRFYAQGGDLVGDLLDGIALQLEAAAHAQSLDDLFDRLEANGQLLRVDERVAPTMYKAPTMSTAELELLRRIDDVVRLGRVRRITRDEVVLEAGTIPARPGDLYVHCAAPGLNPAPAVPIFAERRITLQPIRSGLIPFNAALVGYVEATGRDIREKNRLCPPNRLPDVPLDWVRGLITEMGADRAWSKEPDIARWLEGARLNASRGLRQRFADPQVQDAMARFQGFVRPALGRLETLLAEATDAG